MTDTTGIVVDIGAPSLTGKYADQLVRDAFAGVTYPIWVIVTNHLEANVSLPEVNGLFLRPISTASANYALVEVGNEDQLQQLAASMEQVAISNNSPLAISLNEVPNYGHPVATPTDLNIVPPSMPEPSSHIVPIKTVNGVSILGYGDVALDIANTGAKIDDTAGAGALTVVWSAHKIDEAIKTHTHSNYALKSHTHTEYADVAHTHTGFASATHDHAADYAPLNHAHTGYSLVTHNHNTDYSPLGHTHTGFAPMVHTHTEYADKTHTHTGFATDTHTHTGFATDTHTHSNYALTNHNHTGDYAGINHTHSGYALTSHNHDTEYADIVHTHTIAIADVTGLSAALASVTPASGTAVSTTSTATLTNKTISMASNSLTGTTAEFNAALSDGDFCTLDGTETLTNKTITGLVEKHVALAGNEIDLKLGNLFTKTISAATTLSLKNAPTSGSVSTFILELMNAASFAVSFWAGVKWAGGKIPVFTSGKDVVGFYTYDGGATWVGLMMAKDVK